MGIVKQIKTLGLGFAFERAFERIVPAWLFRCCSVAVYQIESNYSSDGPLSNAVVTICDNAQDLEDLKEVTGADGNEKETIGFVAKIDGKVVGGLWVALGDYLDGSICLSSLLGQEGTWIYSARVDAAHRRQGIYSHLMEESARLRKIAGHSAPFICVSKLNRASHKAIQRFGTPFGEVFVIRVGPIAWARATGHLNLNPNLTLQGNRRPLQLNLSGISYAVSRRAS